MGVDVNEISPILKDVLENRLYEDRVITFLSVNAIVTAIFDAARRISGQEGGNNTQKALKALRNRLLPEIEEDNEQSAAKVAELLKKEAEGGPMQVQRLDYEDRKKRSKVLK